jgi:acyl transferase domain-containing protein
MLQNRFLPPSREDQPSTRLKGKKLQLLSEGRDCSDPTRPMRVAINSLGFGGGNAHVILEEWRDDKQATVLTSPKKGIRLALMAADIRFGSLAKKGPTDRETLANSSPSPFPARSGQRSSLYPLGGYFSGNPVVDRRYLNLGRCPRAV